MFETEVFRKQMYFIEESSCDIVGIFRRLPWWFGAPIVTRRPGNCVPFPSLRSWCDDTNTVVGLRLTNGHIGIHGNLLEDPGVVNTKSD